MLRRFLISLLLRLIDPPRGMERDTDGSDRWLLLQHRSPGFHSYVERRQLHLLHSLSTSSQPNEAYQQIIGRRLELVEMEQKAVKLYEASTKEAQKKAKP